MMMSRWWQKVHEQTEDLCLSASQAGQGNPWFGWLPLFREIAGEIYHCKAVLSHDPSVSIQDSHHTSHQAVARKEEQRNICFRTIGLFQSIAGLALAREWQPLCKTDKSPRSDACQCLMTAHHDLQPSGCKPISKTSRPDVAELSMPKHSNFNIRLYGQWVFVLMHICDSLWLHPWLHPHLILAEIALIIPALVPREDVVVSPTKSLIASTYDPSGGGGW